MVRVEKMIERMYLYYTSVVFHFLYFLSLIFFLLSIYFHMYYDL